MSVVKKKYDRVILIAAAVITILLATLLVLKGISFRENFVLPTIEPKNNLPPNRQLEVETASALLPISMHWVAPDLAGKKPALFVSVPIVEKDGGIFNMNEAEPRLREPVDNGWLVEHGLEFLSADVLAMDADGDGFSNLLEFEGKTNPKNPESHPSFLKKLVFLQRTQENFNLQFMANNHPDYQVERILHNGNRETWFKKEGDQFDGDRFVIEGFEKKEAVVDGITRDVSELIIKDLQTGETIPLPLRTKVNKPTYSGEFRFDIGTPAKITIKKGDTFQLPGITDSTYRLIEVMEDAASIESVPAPGSGDQPEKEEIRRATP